MGVTTKFSGTITRDGLLELPKAPETMAEVRAAVPELESYSSRFSFRRTAMVSGVKKRISVSNTYFTKDSDGYALMINASGQLFREGDRILEQVAGAELEKTIDDTYEELRHLRFRNATLRITEHNRYNSYIENIGERLASHGYNVRLVYPDDSTSRYAYVTSFDNRQIKIRVADHAQPMEGGVFVGGWSDSLQARHTASDISVDPSTSAFLIDIPWTKYSFAHPSDDAIDDAVVGALALLNDLSS